MQRPLLKLLLLATLPVVASFAILTIASASWLLWLQQILASCSAFAIAFLGSRPGKSRKSEHVVIIAVSLMALICLVATLLQDTTGPTRWISFGPMSLYMAPVVLPAFLVTLSVAIDSDLMRRPTFAATVMTAALLAIQPDASQSIAFLVAATLIIVRACSDKLAAGITLSLLTLATVWSFLQPDPLEPVPHVEGVFLLALEYSILAGALVIGCAVLLIVSLVMCALKGFPWLAAVAAYYALLFACSVAGLTPAPLIGYGAGPLLGFGIMVAMSSRAGVNDFSDEPLESTS